MFVTLVYIFFYLIKFELKLDMKMEAFATFSWFKRAISFIVSYIFIIHF